MQWIERYIGHHIRMPQQTRHNRAATQVKQIPVRYDRMKPHVKKMELVDTVESLNYYYSNKPQNNYHNIYKFKDTCF